MHQVIPFESIEPNEEEFDKYQEQLEAMNANIDNIENKYKEIQQIKQDMNFLNDFINETYEKIEKYRNGFKSHLIYISTLFNYYQQNKVNYYILNSIKNLDFTSEVQYLNLINNDDKLKKIETIMTSLKDKNSLNKSNKNKQQINRLNIEDELSKHINLNQILKIENSKLIENYEKLKVKYEKLKSSQKYNSIDKKSLNEDKEINMWISEKYCKSWGLREAIREFIQNQYDGIITEVGTKKI